MSERFETKSFSVGYNGEAFIKDIALSLTSGEILTLIGPNGAGKTTILKSILNQLPPISGAAYLDGREIAKTSTAEIAKEISAVLTDRIRPEMMTCRDVVEMGRYPYTGRMGILSDQDHQIAEDAIQEVNAANIMDKSFARISDGQRQRIMLARALCQQPKVMLLDEPTSFLDIRYKIEFLSILQRLCKEEGLTVIMSLHEVDIAQRISDRIACVKGDRIDRFGTPDEVFTEGYITELFDIKEDIVPEGLKSILDFYGNNGKIR